MTDLEKLESVRKDLLELIGFKMRTKENSGYIIGLQQATLIVDDHIIAELKGENNAEKSEM